MVMPRVVPYSFFPLAAPSASSVLNGHPCSQAGLIASIDTHSAAPLLLSVSWEKRKRVQLCYKWDSTGSREDSGKFFLKRGVLR